VALGIDHWNGSKSQVQNFKASTGIQYPALMQGSSTKNAYGISSNDFSIVIDGLGIIRYYKSGVNPTEIRSVIDDLLAVSSIGDNPPALRSFSLNKAWPNPFNSRISIEFELVEQSTVRLRVFDGQGRFVRHLSEGIQSAGRHTVTWDGTSQDNYPAASGVYFIHLSSDAGNQTIKVVLSQ
jgi:hypothetical protein